MAVGGSKRRGAGTGSTRPGRGKKSDSPAGASNGHLDFTFHSNLQLGHDVQKKIIAAAAKCGFTGDSYFALNLALEEALTNAIKHGNRMDPLKKVHVEARITPHRAEIIVEDEGPGFDRGLVPDPRTDENLRKCSGRGILLIEAYMNKVKWERGGRRLKMVRENRN